MTTIYEALRSIKEDMESHRVDLLNDFMDA